MKKFISAVLCLVMLFCLVSCGNSSTSVTENSNVKETASADSADSIASTGKTIKIMPLGDSLTAGYPDTCAYRNYLCETLLEKGYNFMFVGPYTTPADRIERYKFPEGYTNHAGVGGRTIQGILDAADTIFTEEYKPDVIMLMITTNDFGQGYLVEQIEELYRELVAKIFRAYPDVVLYAANPIPKRTANNEIVELDARVVNWEIPFLKQIAEDKQANGFEMHYVNMTNEVLNFTYEDIREDDKIHPTDSGNIKLANAWFNAIKPTLDELSQ